MLISPSRCFAAWADPNAADAQGYTPADTAEYWACRNKPRAAERLAELGQMTGGLAHEIKNPLSTIGLNAQLLAEGIEDLPEHEPTPKDARQRLLRRLDSLRRETERLRGILTDFLTYAGELRLDPKPTDLNRIIEELADFFSPQAQHQGVRMRLDLHPAPHPPTHDAAHLKHASQPRGQAQRTHHQNPTRVTH